MRELAIAMAVMSVAGWTVATLLYFQLQTARAARTRSLDLCERLDEQNERLDQENHRLVYVALPALAAVLRRQLERETDEHWAARLNENLMRVETTIVGSA